MSRRPVEPFSYLTTAKIVQVFVVAIILAHWEESFVQRVKNCSEWRPSAAFFPYRIGNLDPSHATTCAVFINVN